MEKWSGKIAVVTGASSGIGAAIIKDLASHGITVIGLARRAEKVDEIAVELKELSGKIHSKKCDISDYSSIKEAFKWIDEKFGKVHILINNAGISYYSDILDPSDEKTERLNEVMNTNFTGLVHATREAFRLMTAANDYGIIINIGSILDHTIPFPNPSSIYASTKHAVRALTEVIRQELIMKGIDKVKVANVSPGVVKTNIGHAGGRTDPDNFYETRACLEAGDISQGIIYLLSTPYNVNVTQITIKPVGERF